MHCRLLRLLHARVGVETMTKTATWNGETKNLSEWAATFGVSSTYVSQTIFKKGGVAPAFAFMSTGRKRALPNQLLEYTGPDFTTSTGVRIKKGQKETLNGWEKLTGINKCTIKSRAARGNVSFNDALRARSENLFLPCRWRLPDFSHGLPRRSRRGPRCQSCGAGRPTPASGARSVSQNGVATG